MKGAAVLLCCRAVPSIAEVASDKTFQILFPESNRETIPASLKFYARENAGLREIVNTGPRHIPGFGYVFGT